MCESVVSGTRSIIGCSLLGSVLLSVFKANVVTTDFTVVVSGLTDDNGLLTIVTFWCIFGCIVETVDFDCVDKVVVSVIRGVDVDVDGKCVDVTVVVVIDEPSEKCGIVF